MDLGIFPTIVSWIMASLIIWNAIWGDKKRSGPTVQISVSAGQKVKILTSSSATVEAMDDTYFLIRDPVTEESIEGKMATTPWWIETKCYLSKAVQTNLSTWIVEKGSPAIRVSENGPDRLSVVISYSPLFKILGLGGSIIWTLCAMITLSWVWRMFS